jgi:predicted ATPase/class 3 adenylate cyclase/Tfp pilus assembly protein PilF
MVTFLMTDIEGSTRLWEEHPGAMRAVMAAHDSAAAQIIAEHGGLLVKSRGEGDSLFAVFTDAPSAARAALAIQHGLQKLRDAPAGADGPEIRMRASLHTGPADPRDGDYYGPVVNRCARVRSLAHGGQVLVTRAASERLRGALPAGAELVDRGIHRLRDLSEPEHVFELAHPTLASAGSPIRPLGSTPNNLPGALTTFIGRASELRAARLALDATRMLTFVGPGGCGKTRLAIQLATEVGPDHDGGVWLVEAALLSEPGQLDYAIADALGVVERPDQPLLSEVARHMRASHTMLILDGCERLLDACARVADQLLRACPRLTIIATSREPFAITGESTYRVMGFAVAELPEGRSGRGSEERASRCDAVRLFCERARAVSGSFALTNANAVPVASICRQLDGIPLAIELAAARVRVMPVEQIAARLHDRFRLLSAGSRAGLPHHQTLRGLFDWSYDLLGPGEQALFRRLAAFVGGWALEAAEAVCRTGDSPVADLLGSLVDKSLVLYDEGADRYRMLETVRQYAETLLAECGEEAEARAAHRDHFAAYAEFAASQLVGPDEGVFLEMLEADYGNLRAAMTRCADAPDWAAHGLRIAQALHLFWSERAYYSEARAHCDALLAASADLAGPDRSRVAIACAEMALRQGDAAAAAELLDASEATGEGEMPTGRALRARRNFWRGMLARDRRDYQSAVRLLEMALDDAQQSTDRAMLVTARTAIGVTNMEQGNLDSARRHFTDSLNVALETGSPSLIARSLGNLGCVAELQGEDDVARAFYEEALDRAREVGNRHFVATSLLNLGNIARRRHDRDAARRLLDEAYAMARDMQYPLRIAECLEALSLLSAELADVEQAARLMGAAQATREAAEAPLSPHEAPDIEAHLDCLEESLGAGRFAACLHDGREAAGVRARLDALAGHSDP